MPDDPISIPMRIAPHVVLGALSQSVSIATGRFQVRLADGSTGAVEGELRFRWLPSTAVEIEGVYTGPAILPDTDSVSLAIDMLGVEVQTLVAAVQIGRVPSSVRLVLPSAVAKASHQLIDRLRFHLVNFPDYIGAPIRYKVGDSEGFCAGRLEVASHELMCVVDQMPEVRELGRTAHRDAGYIISHTGELSGVGVRSAFPDYLMDMLHLFFGLIRGAWSGPVFPQGFREDEKVWEQFAAWTVDETRQVPTWLPQRSGLQLSDLFDGFVRKWWDPAWREPLKMATAWYVASNSPNVPHETRIVMSQVALELLAWVEMVETLGLHSRSDFQRLSAAGRLRCLFHHLSIPLDVPTHFIALQALLDGDAADTPGIIARLRNALVHATENSRELIESLSGEQRWEAGQLSLQAVELCLLAVCGYRGKYARRAWRGWKGDDEAIVPWA